MEKLLVIMRNVIISILLLVSCIQASAYDLTKDTVVSNTWDLQGKPLKGCGGIITGGGIIKNAILQGDAFIQMFDTSITFNGCKTREFSVMWMGAKPSLNDNYYQIQRSFNACVKNKMLNVYVPIGVYRYSLPLKIQDNVNNVYQPIDINVYGDGGVWSDATTLLYTATTGFGFSFQLAKGGSLHHLKIQGQWVPPVRTLPAYFSIAQEDFNDRNGACGTDYRGLVIDWDGSRNNSGSTGLRVHDVWVSGFDVLYSISPNGTTQNADILMFDNIRCGNGRVGFVSNQPQEKGNIINNIVSWDYIHTLISIGNSNSGAGNYTINGGNVAGACVRLFNIKEGGWFPSHISNIYAEAFGQVGTIISGDFNNRLPKEISNCVFDFALQSQAGVQTLVTTNNHFIKFSNCIFRYYGRYNDVLKFSGKAVYDNCTFSGPSTGLYTNDNPIITYPIPALARPTAPRISIRKSN